MYTDSRLDINDILSTYINSCQAQYCAVTLYPRMLSNHEDSAASRVVTYKVFVSQASSV